MANLQMITGTRREDFRMDLPGSCKSLHVTRNWPVLSTNTTHWSTASAIIENVLWGFGLRFRESSIVIHSKFSFRTQTDSMQGTSTPEPSHANSLWKMLGGLWKWVATWFSHESCSQWHVSRSAWGAPRRNIPTDREAFEKQKEVTQKWEWWGKMEEYLSHTVSRWCRDSIAL